MCSYWDAEAYPRTNLGRPVDLNCEATRADDLNACIMYVRDSDLSPGKINGRIETTSEQDEQELQRVASANLGCPFRQSSRLQLYTNAACMLAP
jgi:hypothetical protein